MNDPALKIENAQGTRVEQVVDLKEVERRVDEYRVIVAHLERLQDTEVWGGSLCIWHNMFDRELAGPDIGRPFEWKFFSGHLHQARLEAIVHYRARRDELKKLLGMT